MSEIKRDDLNQEDVDRFFEYCCRKLMGLQEYLMLQVWSGHLYDASENLLEDSAAAWIDIDYKYYRYSINADIQWLYMKTIQEDWSDVTGILLHELCHIIVDRMYLISHKKVPVAHQDFLLESREQAVQHIAMLALQGLPDDLLIGPDFE
jgi:hypothetical protein